MGRASVVVLAAGSSSRLGRPKQLVRIADRSLIRIATEAAIGSGAEEVIVVLGAHAKLIEPEIADLGVRTLINDRWSEGMGCSIATGIGGVADQSDVALVMLCDQPTVDAQHLSSLLERAYARKADIVATSYEGLLGVPCVFSRRLFPELLALQKDAGARDLIRSRDGGVECVLFRYEQIDVDTIADLQRLGAQ